MIMMMVRIMRRMQEYMNTWVSNGGQMDVGWILVVTLWL